eukprot:202379_1
MTIAVASSSPEVLISSRLENLCNEVRSIKAVLTTSLQGQDSRGGDGETTDFNCNAENEIDHRLSELKDTIGASMAWVDEGGGLETLVAQDKMRISELESQFESLQSGVSFISKVLQVGEHLKSTDAVLDKFDYSKAVDQMVAVDELLQELNRYPTVNHILKTERGEARPLPVLRRMARKRHVALEAVLRGCIASAIQIDDGSLVVHQSLSGIICGKHLPSPVLLRDLLEGLGRLDLLNDVFHMLTECLRCKILDPLMTSKKLPPPAEITTTSGNSMVSLQFSSSEHVKTVNLGALLERIMSVLEFINCEVMQRDTMLTALMGEVLLEGDGGLMSCCKTKLLEAIPSSISGLNDFRSLETPCANFEQKLIDMGYIEPQSQSLISVVKHADEHFAASRRTSFLSSARSVMLGDYHNSVTMSSEAALWRDDTGWGPTQTAVIRASRSTSHSPNAAPPTRLFVFEPCQITSVAQVVLDMVHVALSESCGIREMSPEDGDGTYAEPGKVLTPPPSVARELFRTARDMIELFWVIVPVHHRDEISSTARTAALFYNDCSYLAFHAMTLGHQYSRRLPDCIKPWATMIDFVPILRDLGETRLRSYVRNQKDALREYMSGVDLSAADSWEDEGVAAAREGVLFPLEGANSAAEEAMCKCTRQLGCLSKAWEEILPKTVYTAVMGELLEIPANAMLEAVLGAEDIGENQTHRLRQAFTALQVVDQFKGEKFSRCYKCWQKFRACRELMEYSIIEIETHMQEGAFYMLSPAELSRLVTAVFEDSPSRTSLLAAIHSQSCH